MNLSLSHLQHNTRRQFLGAGSMGLGAAALAYLTGDAVAKPDDPLAPKQPHFPAKAKAVIHLFMCGAPSHLDLFDYKPALAKFAGKPIPPEITGGQRFAFIRSTKSWATF